jgi:MFS family permease
MVTAMTMAPVHLHHQGVHLHGIGLVVGAHVAGMFAPSPVTGWLTDRFGARPTVAFAGVLLAVACMTVALGEGSAVALVAGLTVLGLGWNAALVAGSAWLSGGANAADRPRLEGYGEVGMGVAAAAGAVASGLVVGAFGYSVLAAGCALASLALVPLGLRDPRGHQTRSAGLASATIAVPYLAEEVVR